MPWPFTPFCCKIPRPTASLLNLPSCSCCIDSNASSLLFSAASVLSSANPPPIRPKNSSSSSFGTDAFLNSSLNPGNETCCCRNLANSGLSKATSIKLLSNILMSKSVGRGAGGLFVSIMAVISGTWVRSNLSDKPLANSSKASGLSISPIFLPNSFMKNFLSSLFSSAESYQLLMFSDLPTNFSATFSFSMGIIELFISGWIFDIADSSVSEENMSNHLSHT